jgi:histidine ammonia-lyase
MWCAEKSRRVVQNAQSIVATEILLAAQGLSLVEDIAASCPLAVATTAVMERIQQYIPARLDGDVWFAADMDAIVTMLKNNSIIDSLGASIEWLG